VIAHLSATYTYEGAAYNVCLAPVSGATTVWRFHKKNGTHFYTASPAERDNVLKNMSTVYSLDGTAFWLAP
jgi:hypothetical protein